MKKLVSDNLFDYFLKNRDYTLLCSNYDDLLKTIKNFKGHEHVAFFYNSEIYRDEIFNNFFNVKKNPNTPSLYYSKKTSKVSAGEILHYDDLMEDEILNMDLVLKQAIRVHSKNKSGFPTKLGGEDSTWYIQKNCFLEHQNFEALLGTSLKDDFSVICGYDLDNISIPQILTVIPYYGIVVCEENDSMFVLNSVLQKMSQKEELQKLEKNAINEKNLIAIGELSSKLAHDLRNPLSIIQATIENLKIQYSKDSKNKKQFDKVTRSIKRMSHQIDDVLGFVKGHDPIKHPIKFSEIIDESMDSIIIPKGVKISTPKNDVELIADKRLFAIAINNLTLNGIQAIEGSGVVEITLEENNESITIQIKDSGIGIPKMHLKKIFQPLFTTKQQGTGLGLASVKSIVESHGGRITVTTIPTIFTIILLKNSK